MLGRGQLEDVQAASDLRRVDVTVIPVGRPRSAHYETIRIDRAAVNQQVVDNPTLINSDPAGEGWLFKLRIADRSQLDGLMDEPAYRALIADAP